MTNQYRRLNLVNNGDPIRIYREKGDTILPIFYIHCGT